MFTQNAKARSGLAELDHEVGGIPKTVLAGTDSLLIQKDTWERMTVMMHGVYIWIMK